MNGQGRAGSGTPGPALDRPGTLCLVRHGETEWSKARKHTGTTDLPLTEHGERQAGGLHALLARGDWALVLSSPRQRARRTAALAGLTDVTVEPDLAEWAYGEYEGLTTSQIRENRPEWTIWTGDPPGGETAAEVAARADRVLDRVRSALAEGPVLAFGHGHFSRVLAARWLGLPPAAGSQFVLGPASPCLLGEEHGVPAVLLWNLPNPADETSL